MDELVTDEKKSHEKDGIHNVFDEISPTYDLVNQVLSFGLDRFWRNQLSRSLSTLKNYALLDLATGTGDQIFSIIKKNPFTTRAVGIDLSQEMLEVAKHKQQKKSRIALADFQVGDALNLEFSDKSFDVITMSFGIRNVTNIDKCLSEMLRVLNDYGKAYVLEFSIPKNKLVKALHLFYLRKILPFIGGIISKKPSAYHYLNETIETFPYGEDLKNRFQQAGFRKVNYYPMTFGITTLYEAIK